MTLDLRFLFRIHLVDIKNYIQGKPASDIIINRLFLNGVVHKSMLGKANILKSDIIKVESFNIFNESQHVGNINNFILTEKLNLISVIDVLYPG